MLKSDRAWSCGKFFLSQVLDKWARKVFLKVVSFDFHKRSAKWKFFSSETLYLAKFLFCSYRWKCWSIVGFFKVLLSFGFSLETPCLPKFLFCIYQPKCSWPVRLQDSLKCNIFRKNWGINLIFCSYKVVFRVRISFSKMYREKFQ